MTLPNLLKHYKLPLIALLGLIFALVSVLSRPTQASRNIIASPPASSYTASVAGIGVIEPRSELISIGVELPGVVREVKVKVGDQVKAGDILFILDQRSIDAEITALEAALTAARIQAQDAQAQYNLISAVTDKRAIARDDLNRRKFARELAHARVAQTQAQLEQAKTTRERQIIRAPIDGEILEVNVRAGEYASIGALATPLMRMGDTSVLHLRVEIDEENASRIRPQSVAQGFLRGSTQNALALTFVRFESFVRPKQNLAVTGQRVDTRVLQVVYALNANTQKHMFVGQQMDVFIEEPAASDAPKE